MHRCKLFAAALVLSSLAFSSLHWAPAQAEEVNGELRSASGKALKDGVVLLVHGTLAHNAMDTIKNLATVLGERGFSTLSVNLSFGVDDRHGMYDCKVAHRHHHLDALKEIGLWVKWLNAKGAGDITLFGHSRGGNQTARYAAETADPGIKRLVLLAPATWDAKSAAAGFERTHKHPLGDGLTALAATFVSYYKPDPRFDTPSILKEIKVPVLVVAGGKDTVVKGLPERVKPMADGKRIRFGVVPDATHFFLDLYAEDVADFIEKFLSPAS